MTKPRLTAPFSGLVEQEVFAVDERSAQLVVRSATAAVAVDIDGQHLTAPTTNGVAVLDVADLAPETTYRAVLSNDQGQSLGELSVRTRPSLGPVLSRFATISDVHLGAGKFGPSRSLTDAEEIPHSLRCGRGALDDAAAWGAEVLLVKGDLTDTGDRSDWELAEQMFTKSPIPFLITPGNHDVWKTRQVDPDVGAALLGVSNDPVQTYELDGVRLVLGDTSKPDKGTGDLVAITDALTESIDVDRPAFIGLHHNIQRTPVPWFWPPGIPSTTAMPAVRALAATNPRLFLSSGHTHRNRRHHLGHDGKIVYTEVSATADYPGVWAGYEVTETAIRQTVRRIASPGALSWTEATRSAIKGIWPRWSQGLLDDRCVDSVFSA